jgi:hypothetical protein
LLASNRLVVALLAGNGWRYLHSLRFALPSVFGEDKAPLDIMAFRTYEGAPLEARDRHCVVLVNLHQNHLSIADETTHRMRSE